MDNFSEMEHGIVCKSRNELKISGVRDVLGFDDETIQLDTVAGRMTVKGEKMHIVSFHTESGDLSAEGKLHAIAYVSESRGGFSRLFR